VPADQLRDRLQSSLGAALTLERELGGGGMARVFVATDRALARQVVVKVLSPDTAEGMSADRFTREIRLAAALQDPHIVPVLTTGQTADGLPYYTMPFVTGESLRARMGRGRLPLDEALRVLRDVAEALEYAHARGVVHRDIKPENVLLAGRNALVADFGIAKAIRAAQRGADRPGPGARGAGDDSARDVSSSALTVVGTSLGTPAYMAPEQAVGDHTDHRADLYAWGMIAYELLAGAHPFAEKKTQGQLVAAQVAETPASLDERQPGLPPGLGPLVMACLAKDPSERPADGSAVLAALAAVTSSRRVAASEVSAPNVGATPAARRRAMVAGASLAALAGLAGLGRYLATGTPFPTADATPAIAVLPFEHQGDSAEAYVTDGITDEIRGRLTGVRELLVIARASSNRYAGSGASPGEIAKELDVRYLLTGTVRVIGSGAERRVVVRPELVEVTRDGRAQSRWQAPFEAEFRDVIGVQSEIAGRVVSAMELPTSAEDRARATAVMARDPAAYDLYLKAQARVDWGSRSDAASNVEAIPLYAAAVARDSTMVEAWAGLTSALVLAYANGVPSKALEERSRVAALRTLALDPVGATGASAHGMYLRLVKRDKVRALDELRRAVVASPSDAASNSSFGTALFDLGRLEEALPYFEKARRLDPRLPARAQADVLAALGRLSEARELASQAWSMSPAVRAAAPRVSIELAAGDTAAARHVAEQAMRDLPTDQVLGDLGSNALGWVLAPGDVRRLLALGPAAFPDGPSGRALVRARHYYLQGDSAGMRQWADSAQRLRRVELRDVPNDTRLVTGLASAEAFRGRGAAALDLARRAIATERRLAGGAVSRNLPDLLFFAAEVAVVAGERDAALAWLGELLATPSIYTPAYLRVDPTWAPLRGDPRFEALLAAKGLPSSSVR
jgi:serine/threonine-protein kinase